MLSKQKFSILFFTSLTFLVALYFGFQVGDRAFASNATSQDWQEKRFESTPDLKNNFLLLIQVSDLTAKNPYLESVWLLNFRTETSTLYFFPLLPSQAEEGAHNDQELTSVFSLDKKNQPNDEFFQRLINRNVAWQGYLIVDQYATKEIIDFLNGVAFDGEIKNGEQILESLNSRSQDRILAQYQQAHLLKAVCHQAAGVSLQTSFTHHLKSMPDHVLSGGVPASFWEADWRAMKGTGDINCDAPTLTGFGHIFP